MFASWRGAILFSVDSATKYGKFPTSYTKHEKFHKLNESLNNFVRPNSLNDYHFSESVDHHIRPILFDYCECYSQLSKFIKWIVFLTLMISSRIDPIIRNLFLTSTSKTFSVYPPNPNISVYPTLP